MPPTSYRGFQGVFVSLTHGIGQAVYFQEQDERRGDRLGGKDPGMVRAVVLRQGQVLAFTLNEHLLSR